MAKVFLDEIIGFKYFDGLYCSKCNPLGEKIRLINIFKRKKGEEEVFYFCDKCGELLN